MDLHQGVLIILTYVVGRFMVGYVSSYLIITQIFKEPFSKMWAIATFGERFKLVGLQRQLNWREGSYRCVG